MSLRQAVGLLIVMLGSVAHAQWRPLPGLASDVGIGARGAV
jgi:hypothetical protein